MLVLSLYLFTSKITQSIKRHTQNISLQYNGVDLLEVLEQREHHKEKKEDL